jgi:uncharacterized protein YcaQ
MMSKPLAVSTASARARVLLRQGLAGGRLPTVMDAIVATAGVYATAPTCYLSCAARVDGFRLDALDEELYRKRSLVRIRCMRQGMVYIEPVDLLPVLFACTGEDREKTLTRIAKWSELSEEEVLELADRIESEMSDRPPVTVREIRQLLGAEVPGGSSALQFTVGLLGRYGRIVRAEVRGSWRSDNFTYALWRDWVGDPVAQIDPAEARAILARRYLSAFGPATTEDLRWWTGWTKRDTVAALDSIAADLVQVAVDGTDAWMLADELDSLTTVEPDEAAGLRLLPVWDTYFMGYAPAGRARQVSKADFGRVYERAGNATSIVALDGVAAGVWELDEEAGIVRLAAFGDEVSVRWPEVEAEAARLGDVIDAKLRVERVPVPVPLTDAPRNAFLSPITLSAQ